MNDVKYPYLNMRLVGRDGNAFSIMGRLARTLRIGGVPKPEIDAVLADMQSSDYDHLLRVAMATVICDADDGEEDEFG